MPYPKRREPGRVCDQASQHCGIATLGDAAKPRLGQRDLALRDQVVPQHRLIESPRPHPGALKIEHGGQPQRAAGLPNQHIVGAERTEQWSCTKGFQILDDWGQSGIMSRDPGRGREILAIGAAEIGQGGAQSVRNRNVTADSVECSCDFGQNRQIPEAPVAPDALVEPLALDGTAQQVLGLRSGLTAIRQDGWCLNSRGKQLAGVGLDASCARR